MAHALTDILNEIHERPSRSKGIGLAIDYLAGINSCLGDATCAAKFASLGDGERWAKALKDAEQKLVYRDSSMLVVKESVTSGGSGLTPGAIMDFDCILTSTTQDRDKDVMEVSGADVDPQGPLLWMHLPFQPIGKHLRIVSNDGTRIIERNSIADLHNNLTQDAATLVEFGGLRISVGFNPIEAEPVRPKAAVSTPGNGSQGKAGWHILKFEVLERSLVSIPANTDAVITAFSRQKLHDPLVLKWAENLYRQRPTVSWLDEPKTKEATMTKETTGCRCGGTCSKCSVPTVTATKDAAPTAPSIKTIVPAAAKKYGPFIGMPYFQGSYEWLSDELDDSIRDKLGDALGLEKMDDAAVIATFPTEAVFCVRKRSGPDYYGYGGDGDFDEDDGYHYYRHGYAMTEGRPVWADGEPTKVELTASVTEASTEAKAFRKTAKGIFMSRIKSGRAVSAKNMATLKEAHDLFAEVYGHDKTTTAHKDMCKGCMSHLKDVMGSDDDSEMDEDDKGKSETAITTDYAHPGSAAVTNPGQMSNNSSLATDKPGKSAKPQAAKAGSVLSKANATKCIKCYKDACAMAGHAEMHRLGKSAMRECAGHLKSVITGAGFDPVGKDENPEMGGGANPGVEPTEANPGIPEKSLTLGTLCCKTMGRLLAKEEVSPAILESLKEAVEEALERGARKQAEAMLTAG